MKCQNSVCKAGPDGKAATADLHPNTGLCPVCQFALVTGPKPKECMGCPLYEIGEGYAYGVGPSNADMMLVGEALGEEEARRGLPFVGGSGRVLTALLGQAGIRRDDIYITNAVKCRPPKNRKPDDEEIRWCARYLVNELKLVNPKLLVPVGATALYVTTGKAEIGSYRGIPIEGAGGRKVLPTFHPAFVMRTQTFWPVVVWDLVKAKKESEFREVRRVAVEYSILPDAADHAAAVRREAQESGFISVDAETTSLDLDEAHIKCYGVGSAQGRARVFRWTLEAQRLLYGLLTNPTIVKVGQNSESYDWPLFERKRQQATGENWHIAPNTCDTMLMFHLTNSDLPKSLDTIKTFYTDMEHWKDDSMYKGDEVGLATGCAKDVDATTRSYLGLRQEIHSMGMDNLLYNNVMPLQPILRRMADRGIRKDVDKAEMWAQGMLIGAAKYEQMLRDAVGMPNLNVQSPKELMKLLYDKLGLPVQYTKDQKGGMRPTANAGAVETLVEKFPENKILGLINEVRSAYHTVSTNLEVETDDEGFVHPRFGCAKAATGRINSWDPNAQNIPKKLREIYIPDTPDHVFISVDWSQVEWRIAMALSGDPYGLSLLAAGADIHEVTAAEGFGLPLSRVRDLVPGKQYNYRYATKFIVYGLGYGRGAQSIAQQLGTSKTWVEGFLFRFFTKYHVYEKWRKGLEEQVERQHFLANPFGRRRWWYTRQVTEMYNFPPQSTGADMMYVAIREADEQLPKGATVRLTVHDELVVVSHRDVVKEATECLTAVMQRQWPEIVEASRDPATVRKFYPQGWRVPAEPSFGPRNWMETKLEGEAQATFRKELGL